MKQTIRLTERELHRLISESVKRVLLEGTVVNNKPKYKSGIINPGFDYSEEGADNTAKLINATPELLQNIKDGFREIEKHNQRANNKNAFDAQGLCNRNKSDREYLLNMLHTLGISAKYYQSLSPEEQDQCWDIYNDLEYPDNRWQLNQYYDSIDPYLGY